jgi:hypothetical protein
MKWVWKHKVHFLIWAVLIVYLLTATRLYVAFILRNGKPIQEAALPEAQFGTIVLNVDRMETTFYDGENLYVMSGWVFDPAIAESGSFRKKLVLHSAGEDLVFPAYSLNRVDLNGALPQYNMDLYQAGFQVFISKDVLRTDNYQIGFLLEDETGARRTYRLAGKYIERKPNGLRFIQDP